MHSLGGLLLKQVNGVFPRPRKSFLQAHRKMSHRHCSWQTKIFMTIDSKFFFNVCPVLFSWGRHMPASQTRTPCCGTISFFTTAPKWPHRKITENCHPRTGINLRIWLQLLSRLPICLSSRYLRLAKAGPEFRNCWAQRRSTNATCVYLVAGTIADLV